MKRSLIKVASVLMSLMVMFTVLSACGNKSSQTQSTATTSTVSDAIDKINLPIVKVPLTLKYWYPISGIQTITTLDDSRTYQELQKRTGITIQFIHPAQGQEKDQFNLMVASNDLPDIILYDFVNNYPGGVDKAISDKVIIPLNNLISNYSPNLKKKLSGDSLLDKTIKMDNGNYFCYPSFRRDPITKTYIGPAVRQDLLDEMKMAVPETIDDWYIMLKTAKEKYNMIAPLTTTMNFFQATNAFEGAYGVGYDFYRDNDVVKYGKVQPEYKQFLETWNKWFEEGLLDPDFATIDMATYQSRIVGSKSIAFLGQAASGIGGFTVLGRVENPKFTFVGAPYPVLKKGDVAKFGHGSDIVRFGSSAYITTQNKYQKETAMLLDYGYSTEGNLLYNFGIEGESYTMQNGNPVYTDLINKNPKGLTLSQAIAPFVVSGPFETDGRYMAQTLLLPEQIAASKTWANTKTLEYSLPPLMPAGDDSKKLTDVMSGVNTYVNEMFLKFTVGQEPLSNFDKYVQQVNSMGINDAIKIKQKALDNFNKR